METRINYMLVGLFVIILTISLVVAGLWLSAGLSQKKYETYVVYVDESVSGLNVKSPVKYNGVQIGYVAKIKLNKHNPKQVKLFLNIEEGTPISAATRAELDTQGLTGVAYLELTGGGNNLPPLTAKPGEKYPVIISEPSFLFRLDTALDDLTKHIDIISLRINDLLSKENVKAMSATLANTEKVTQTFANNDQAIDRIIGNSDTTMQKMPDTVTNINDAAEKATVLLQRLDQLAKKTQTIIENGQTMTQTINQQILPKTATMLDQTNHLLESAQQFAQQLETNPSILIRGRQALPPGPGER